MRFLIKADYFCTVNEQIEDFEKAVLLKLFRLFLSEKDSLIFYSLAKRKPGVDDNFLVNPISFETQLLHTFLRCYNIITG